FVVRFYEIRIEGHELRGRQHSLVDHDLRLKAANVEQMALGEPLVAAQDASRALANQVELALECVALEAFTRRDEELLDVRLRRSGRLTEVRAVGIDRD